jgi:hypothetical protein
MKVLLTHPPVANVHAWEGPAFVASIRDLFLASRNRRGHELTDDPAAADLILYLEPNCFRDRPYAELLLREDFVRHFPEKCFAYNYGDFFMGYLPGIYSSLPQEHAHSGRFASWNYILGLPNPLVEEAAPRRDSVQPKLLFSFRGSRSAKVRGTLLDHKAEWTAFGRLTELDKQFFYNLTPALKSAFVDEILESRFVLCPRGLGCASHRLFETMVLGRVPVILSDAWVPPTGPAWDNFSVRVAERDAARLPEILRPLEKRSAEMGHLAREAWDQWFAPEVRIPLFFDRLAELARQQPKEKPDYAKLWRSGRFYAPYGLAPHQKFWKNLRQGTVFKKLARKLRLSS